MDTLGTAIFLDTLGTAIFLAVLAIGTVGPGSKSDASSKSKFLRVFFQNF
jgi:hypothetical protein